ncbi:hypothetical protein ACRAQ6_10835 [Erythrobacter sp. HA6-11]
MRIALLSALENLADGRPRALVPLGGRPIIAWQIDLAKTLGCEKLLCLVEGGGETSEEVERHARAAGLEIDFIGGPRHLLGKITADQDLLVIADGLLFDPEIACEHFAERRGVASISDYPGVEKGFERIDPEHAWAGLLVARGSIGEQLSDMPADGDTVSLLLRMALQSGTRLVPVDELHLNTGEVLLVRSPNDLVEREKALLDNSAAKASWAGPGEKLGSLLARSLAPDYLENGPAIALGIGGASLAGGLILSWYGLLVASLAVIGLGSLAISLSQALRHLRSRLSGSPFSRRFAMAINAIVDLVIVAALALPQLPKPILDAVFEPVLLVGLWRLAARLGPKPMRPFWRDRMSLALILLGFASVGVLSTALPAMILILLFFLLISEGYARLTQV